MSAEVKFLEGEPPPVTFRGDRQGKWMRLADRLKERPGVWAEVDRGTVTAANSGCRRLRVSGCETMTRKDHETGEVVLYARWPA
jgi:hypothetical protein